MSNEALILLVQNGLFFNEANSSNPFSYLTTVVSNEFKKIKEKEKEQQTIRDELLIECNLNPSYTRQYNEEYEHELARYTRETMDTDEPV
jgi:ABC-type dipeptide/oligopeptide/nickel transport system ATPase subunit